MSNDNIKNGLTNKMQQILRYNISYLVYVSCPKSATIHGVNSYQRHITTATSQKVHGYCTDNPLMKVAEKLGYYK